MIEKKWAAVPYMYLTAPGTTNGVITVSSTSGFKVKMSVGLADPNLPPKRLEVKRITSPTTMELGPIGARISDREDLSAYGWTSFIFAQEQNRNDIPLNEIDRATYEEEPVVARRVIAVDEYGVPYSRTNPMPILNVLELEGNIDGGHADTIYGGVPPINCGGA